MRADGLPADTSLLAGIRQYALLILKRGAVLQEGQRLVITAPPDAAAFARILTEEAFRAGAADVRIRYVDEAAHHHRLRYAGREALLAWLREEAEETRRFSEAGACFVRLDAAGQPATEPLPPDRLALVAKLTAEVQRDGLAGQMAFPVRRQASAVATVPWAKQLFPHLPVAEALQTLWRTLLHIVHADGEDALADWDRHMAVIQARKAWLDRQQLTALHIRSGSGTDLTVGLADDARWVGGTVTDAGGTAFSPSMPTDEVFTAPHRDKVNGTVVASMPLMHEGQRIDGFALTFKDGQVTEVQAAEGLDALDALISTDEGAGRLGEVALVPADSRTARTGLAFGTVLCDENRACHLALGAGYPGSVGGADRTAATLYRKGLNRSAIHVDFMFGTDDLTVNGTTRSGQSILLMDNGRIAF